MASQGQTPSPSALAAKGPPYPPQGAQLGGVPTPSVDDPIIGVLLAFFVAGAVLNMTIFQLNRRREHKFVLSALLFGFCMARIVANVLRLVWASHPTDASIAIAASVFNNAGVLLLFVVNLIFAQRILRAYHPHIGWSKPVKLAFRFLYFSIVANLVMVIIAVVYMFYTLDAGIRGKLRKIQLTAVTYLAVLAFLPLPITLLSVLLPRKAPMDKFGQGRMRTKVGLLVFTSSLLTFGAGFRAGAAYYVRPANQPMWFHHKAAFYTVNFVIELIVVYAYAISRFDRRFHIPNGSKGPGDYSSSIDTARSKEIANNINTEEEVFGETEPPQTISTQKQREQEWENNLQDELKQETV